jgi:hypothetical protein
MDQQPRPLICSECKKEETPLYSVTLPGQVMGMAVCKECLKKHVKDPIIDDPR